MKNAFLADTITGRYRCFACGSRGTQLGLWSAATDLPLYTSTYRAAISSNSPFQLHQ